jgi:trk system potassium uptake protein TrkH
MGVLVFVMALLPNLSDRSIHIMRAEMPGPVVGKLVPRAKDTAKILYLIYIVMTAAQIVLLLVGGMPFFDSVVHALGTAGTGGFAIKADGLAGYSPYLQWVITVFMLLFGINFNLYYLILIRRLRSVFRSTELWAYVGIVVASVAVITTNIYSMCSGFSEALRLSAFQVSAIITTTGYSTTDFNLWPGLSKAILLMLMFIGGSAGSTAGGFKVSRVVLLGKSVKREFKRVLHPRTASVIKANGKRVDEETVWGVMNYLTVYVTCIVVIFLLISFEPFGVETNLTAVVSCFNNIGPGLAQVGPALNYGSYTIFTKIVLTLAMLLGRLEIYPILLTLLPRTWLRK